MKRLSELEADFKQTHKHIQEIENKIKKAEKEIRSCEAVIAESEGTIVGYQSTIADKEANRQRTELEIEQLNQKLADTQKAFDDKEE